MQLFKSPQLLIPVLVVILLFLFDKIFLIPEVRKEFMQPGGMVYYKHRQGMLDTIKKQSSSRDILVLGDSRSFGIGTDMAKAAGFENRIIWNMAGPQAVPAYHYYIAKKVFTQTNRPGTVFIGISPDGLNRTAGIFSSPVLNYGTDHEFFENHKTMIPEFDRERYIQSRRFALVGMQFSLRTFIRRLRGTLTNAGSEKLDPMLLAKLSPADRATAMSLARASSETLANYSYENSDQIRLLNYTNGAQYAWFGKMSDSNLKKETDQLVALYLQSFRPAAEQLFYFEQTLKLLEKNGVRTVVFWPKVNPHLQQVYRNEPKMIALWKRIRYLSGMYGARAIDLNEVVKCSDYYDASHMSISCYPEITEALFRTAGI